MWCDEILFVCLVLFDEKVKEGRYSSALIGFMERMMHVV
jgi:hypothetical protein